MVIQSVRIGEKALRLFVKAVTKLQECGGETDDDDLWSFAIDPSHNVEDDVSDSLPERIRCLEAVEDVLHGLLDSCERKLTTVKAAFWPQVSDRGIQDLPDEILSEIFESVVEDDDESGLLQSSPEMVLTRVCSRFRSLALSTPALWAYIESTMSSNEAAARLERSKDCLLKINIYERNWCANVHRFLGLVVPHAHRWNSFISDLWNYDPAGDLEVSMMNLQLPQLESLDVRNIYLGFSRNWDMPKLRYVRISPGQFNSHIPPAAGIFSAQTLRSLNFDGITFSLEVVDYLTSVPNLTELRITTSRTSNLDVFGIHGTLPKVRKMSLQISDKAALLVLIGRLQMPELSTLDLDVCNGEVWDMAQIQSLEMYPSVYELNISYVDEFSGRCGCYCMNCCGTDSTRRMDLSPLFALCPEVQRLNLLNCCSNFKVTGGIKAPPLLRISAPACQEDGYFLRSLVEGLKQDGRWEEFEFFQPKAEISWNEANAIFTEEKLRWYE